MILTYLHRLIDKNQGSISISDFMRIALYHNEYGYYMSKLSFGKDGDFITAPEISQLFGEIIAVWVICIWEKLGRPSKFSLVELGPGRGTLILDIIRVTRRYSDFFNSMSIHLIEISPILQKIQKQKLKSLDVSWHENINSLPKQATIFLANEFFDALPINQFVYYNERWYENRVTKRDNGSLFIIADRFSVKKEIMYFNTALNSKLFYGAVVEVSSFRIDILKKLEEKIYNNKGAALIIDYGYIYPEYRSTLQSLKQHKYVSIFEDIGSSDITALVNFQELIDSLRYVDYEILTQREFLYIFGIKERVQALMKNLNSTQKNKIFCEYLRLTKNMGTLFKVMMIYCL